MSSVAEMIQRLLELSRPKYVCQQLLSIVGHAEEAATKEISRARTLEVKLTLLLTRSAKQTLEAAAAMAHSGVDEFVLESALGRANEILANRCLFGLSAR